MANPTWTPGYTPPYFQVHPFPRRQQSLPAALLQFITDLEANDNDVTNYADDEIHFRPNNTRNQPPTATEAPDPDAGDFFRVTLSDGTEEVWEHDGTNWVLRATIEPNAATYSVVVNATGGTAQAFPMSTVAGGAVVVKAPTGFEITATDVGTIINGCVYFNMPANNQTINVTVAAVPPAPAPPVTDYTLITQAAHGIPARPEGFTPIYNDAGVWKLASALADVTIHDGFAVNITANTFYLVRDGFLTVAGHGLTVSADYFLQDDGTIDTTAATINDIVAHVVDADTIRLIDNRWFAGNGANARPTERLVQTYTPTANQPISNTVLTTGIDLTTYVTGSLRIYTRDNNDTTGRGWPYTTIDIAELLRVGSAFGHTFDNDYLLITLSNAATGGLQINDPGRAQKLLRIELWQVE